jgi:ArsR family transcriptional regulator, arsenate/arsenite/antimonite-responsive transcriptional repressor
MHLSIFTRAGLVSSQRRSRSIVYRADLARFQEVPLFLIKDCCDGRPEICAPSSRASRLVAPLKNRKTSQERRPMSARV